MMAKLGDGMTEDVLESGSRQRFGVSGAEAQAEMDKLETDTDFQQKLKNKDAAALSRRHAPAPMAEPPKRRATNSTAQVISPSAMDSEAASAKLA